LGNARRIGWRALGWAALLALAGYGLRRLGLAMPLWIGLLVLLGVVAALMPRIGVSALDRLGMLARALRWRHEEGRHHAFGDHPLHVVDDGRFSWVAGDDLQRVLQTRDADDVLAARHAGRWRRDEQGRLLLRVDSVVTRLASGPGRMEPRVVRLRRYFERAVLFPAAERRRRGG
jgi:hypothetical protein